MGAHSDDIEIGCGGTILRLLSEYDDVEVNWVVIGSSGQRDGEAVASASKFLADAKKEKLIIKHFKESFFPYVGEEIKGFFEKLKRSVTPDIIFTHYRHDLHQDHRLISGIDMEYLSGSFHPRIRNHKVRWRSWGTQFFCSFRRKQICRKKIEYHCGLF